MAPCRCPSGSGTAGAGGPPLKPSSSVTPPRPAPGTHPGRRTRVPHLGDPRVRRGWQTDGMSTSLLSSFSDAIADAVGSVAPSVVQVGGRRRPLSGLVYDADVVLTNARSLGREDHLKMRTHD